VNEAAALQQKRGLVRKMKRNVVVVVSMLIMTGWAVWCVW
jgi:hypothetical protein